MKIVFWGTYDTGKPRNRILIRGLQENGAELTECHVNLWNGVDDKSQLKTHQKILVVLKWMLSYPGLVVRYLFLPKHDLVLIGYLGHLDVIVLWPFTRIRGTKIIWDAFLSLHDTVVSDRKIVPPNSLKGKFLYWWEAAACRLADRVILDTEAQRRLFVDHYRLEPEKTGSVLVGVESEIFPHHDKDRRDPGDDYFNLLFYGQFIPLHGIPCIIGAARLLAREKVRLLIIGKGHESKKIAGMMKEVPLENVRFIPWVQYEELHGLINNADICLGIFGETGKASRVIPNKVFQIIQARKPLITLDTEAIRELLEPDMKGVYLVPESTPEALAKVILEAMADSRQTDLDEDILYSDIRDKIQPAAIGKRLLEIMVDCTG